MKSLNDLKGKYGLILMGIAYDNKNDLIASINEWNKEVGFIQNGEVTDIEEIENRSKNRNDILVSHTGVVNPIKRIQYADMGWKWAEDYLNNKLYK